MANVTISDFTEKERWEYKQALAKPGRYYGNGGTWHDSSTLDIETDSKGRVISVWFRCQALPFVQVYEDDERAKEMKAMYAHGVPRITGVEVIDQPKD